MASFSFDFLAKETPAPAEVVTKPKEEEEERPIERKRKRPPFVWIPNVDQLLVDRAKEEIVYSEVSLQEVPAERPGNGCLTPIRCVDLETSSFSPKQKISGEISQGYEEAPSWKETDLQPSVYEGGMKVWECSLDLLRYLAEISSQSDSSDVAFLGRDVLELGCGHGLPSSFLLRETLRRQTNGQSAAGSFTLTDFNDFVVQDATLSNLVLNTTANVVRGADEAFVVNTTIKLGFGDWLEMSRQLQSTNEETATTSTTLFGVILAAETIYSDQAAADTALLLARHLQPEVGVGLVATKRYYFGVGGGSDVFSRAALVHSLQVETVRTYDNGTGNIRELLRVTRPA